MRNTIDDQRDQDDGDGPELAPQVGHGALLDGGGDLDHLRRALVGGEDAAHQEEADGEGEEGGDGREDQPEPLAPAELEGLVAAFGGEDVGAFARAPRGRGFGDPKLLYFDYYESEGQAAAHRSRAGV